MTRPCFQKNLVVIFLLTSTTLFAQTPTVGNSIQADFDGDGKTEFAFAVKVKEQVGNPMEDGTPAEYSVNFSSEKMKSFPIGCCETRLINEGDLNNDGSDELTVFQLPMNGTTCSLITYAFSNGKWRVLINPILFASGGDYMEDDILQKRIFKEGNIVYYLAVDPNDVKSRLVKRKAILLN